MANWSAEVIDPYAVLGVARNASTAEIKRAYRALAKQFHPDSAGPSALPRFLAIQEAYEILVGDGPGAGPRSARTGPTRPWSAEAGPARATRDAYRSRRTRPSGGRQASGRATGDGPSGGGRRSARRERPPDRATPGSTSYDGADAEPFTPDWQGGSWYGASSGTYWTINPKEYADPRKHGPEYQARGRRPDGDAEPAPATGSGEARSTTDAGRYPPSWARGAPPPRPAREPGGLAAESASPSLVERLLRGDVRTPVARVGLTLLGWPPLAVGLGVLVGEVSGCARFSADCSAVVPPLTLLAQLAIAIVLLALPRLAGIAAAGAIGMLLAALPATAALVPDSGPVGATGNHLFAGVALVVGWLAGAALAAYRPSRAGYGPPPAGP